MAVRPVRAMNIEAQAIDQSGREAFLRLAGLVAADHPAVSELQREIIAPNAQAIIDDFYGHLREAPEFEKILSANGSRIEGLKTTYRRYLLNFGVDFESPGYFQDRLRIGAIHAAVGVPLSMYVTSGNLLQQLLVDRIFARFSDMAHARNLMELVFKLTALDTALVIEAYHGTRVGELETSVEALRVRGERLAHDLSTDALTGVTSRRSLLEALARTLEQAGREGQRVGLIVLDLDHFKQINDRYGHGAGDKVLQVTAARIRSSLRPTDTVGRYGGEEFLIILPNTDLPSSIRIAERVRSSLNKDAVHTNDERISVTASQGVAVCDGSEDAKSLIERADAALYAAKRAGRDRIVAAEQTVNRASDATLSAPGHQT